jgi:hypothetical protein
MFTAAVIISILTSNTIIMKGYYAPSSGGYVVVNAPVDAEVSYLPAGYTTVEVSKTTYYYYGGLFMF